MSRHALIAAGPGGPKTVLDLSPAAALELHSRLDRLGVDSAIYRPGADGWVELRGTMPRGAHADLLPFNHGDRDHDHPGHSRELADA
jgi:hypothetical protein